VYLRLLLVHLNTEDAKDTETHLWMNTSHAFISAYKEHIKALDGTTARLPRPRAQEPGASGPVEHRKLVQRFRQFLAEEERFWQLFILRARRALFVVDVDAVLRSLDIMPDEPALDENARPTQLQALFPPEPAQPAAPLPRDVQLAILGKALVCLGDLARYKEQYNASGGRPRAGQEHGPPAMPTRRPGRRGRGGGHPAPVASVPRERDYDRAERFYEAARKVVPADGNPHHQLAILATYKRETFGALVHYIRSLCVQQPYEPGADNMGSMLKKELDAWKAVQKQGGRAAGEQRSPKERVDLLKENIIVLHGLWLFGGDKCVPAIAFWSSSSGTDVNLETRRSTFVCRRTSWMNMQSSSPRGSCPRRSFFAPSCSPKVLSGVVKLSPTHRGRSGRRLPS
jgi:protein SMG7